MSERIRVALVDDQQLFRAGIRMLISSQSDLEFVGEAGNGVEAVALAASATPDVMLMDVRMPEVNGLDAAATILASPSPDRPHILMLTTFDVDDYVYEALRIGASGFMLKDAPAEELARAVRVVAQGDSLLAPSVTKRLIAEVTKSRSGVPKDSPRLRELTPRELEVLELIARGLSNTEIATRLFVAEQTVKTHVSRVLAKLGLRDRAQAVVFAYEHGVVSAG